jgi:hypothetical protein
MSLLERVRTVAGTATSARPASPPRTSGAAPATGFDHVELPSDGVPGTKTRLSKLEFDALPLQERIGLLIQGTLRFYRAGSEVPPSEAMRASY